jgi:hypothetical protein
MATDDRTDVTRIYCRPGLVDTAIGAVEVDEVLAMLALELGLEIDGILRSACEASAIVPWTSPEDTWAAMDRVVPPWRQAKLFLLPRSRGIIPSTPLPPQLQGRR